LTYISIDKGVMEFGEGHILECLSGREEADPFVWILVGEGVCI
jgi:hypothetical protein